MENFFFQNFLKFDSFLHNDPKIFGKSIKCLISEVEEIFKKQPVMLSLDFTEAKTINVVGDIHGQFTDLLRIFDHVGYPSQDR